MVRHCLVCASLPTQTPKGETDRARFGSAAVMKDDTSLGHLFEDMAAKKGKGKNNKN